jgi:hypothetical protein
MMFDGVLEDMPKVGLAFLIFLLVAGFGLFKIGFWLVHLWN